MKAKELYRKLGKLVKKYGDADVVFDTDAVCFDVHLVDVKSIHPVPKKMSGSDRDILCLHWDMAVEPFHFKTERESQIHQMSTMLNHTKRKIKNKTAACSFCGCPAEAVPGDPKFLRCSCGECIKHYAAFLPKLWNIENKR